MGFGPLTDPLTDPLTIVALSGIHAWQHTELGHFGTADGIELTKVQRPTQLTDGPWSL